MLNSTKLKTLNFWEIWEKFNQIVMATSIHLISLLLWLIPMGNYHINISMYDHDDKYRVSQFIDKIIFNLDLRKNLWKMHEKLGFWVFFRKKEVNLKFQWAILILYEHLTLIHAIRIIRPLAEGSFFF